MLKNNKYLACLIISLIAITVFAQNAPSKQPVQKDGKLAFSEIEKILNSVSEKLTAYKPDTSLPRKLEDDTLKAIQLKGYVNQLSTICDYPDLEYDTKIYKRWYLKIKTVLNDMYIPKEKMESAILNKDTKGYEEAKKQFEEIQKNFKLVFNKPEKIPQSEYTKIADKKQSELQKRKK